MDKTIKINPDKTYTKSEYSKTFKVHRVTLDKRIREGKILTIQVKGVILIRAQ